MDMPALAGLRVGCVAPLGFIQMRLDMLGLLHSTGTDLVVQPLAQASTTVPLVVLILCVVAGLGTVLVLPSPRRASLRRLGGVACLLAGLVGIVLLIRHAAGLPGESGQIGFYFWAFSILAIFGAFRVVTHPRPVYSALYFILAVMAGAGLFVLLHAEFMAAALVIIYAGAILVTYVFVIMLAAQAGGAEKPLAGLAEYDRVSREPVFAAAVGFVLMGVLIVLIFDQSQAAVERANPEFPTAAVMKTDMVVEGSTQKLGYYLFNHQILNLELAGLMLTMAMVGSVVIARRRVVDAVVTTDEAVLELQPVQLVSDNPHRVPIDETKDPRQKAYPEQ